MSENQSTSHILRQHRLTLFAVLGITTAAFILLGNLFVLVVRDAQERMIESTITPVPIFLGTVAADPGMTNSVLQATVLQIGEHTNGITDIQVFEKTDQGFVRRASLRDDTQTDTDAPAAVAAQALPNQVTKVMHENGQFDVAYAYTNTAGEVLGYVDVSARTDLLAAPIERNLIRTLVVLLIVLTLTFFTLAWFMNVREHRKLLSKTTQRLALQDELIARVVHEVQNPITVADGYLTMLKETELSSTAMGYLTKVNKALSQLKRFVQHADLAVQLDQRRIPLHVQSLPVAPVVQSAIEEVVRASVLDKEVITFSVQTAATVQADKARLQFTLEQVLHNAVQHGAAPITVTVRVEGGDVYVVVADAGEGIAEKDAALVTEKWYRGAHARYGSGLGMWLANKLVKEMHGSIHIARATQGTVVTLQIPRAIV